MTDRDGDVVQVYGYHAFGAERYKQNSQAFPVTHRYTGQALDEETGLYFYNARYYDPELGRFTQPDTIVPDAKDPQTFNRYAYVNNNPLKYSDPSGHEPISLTVLIVGTLIAASIGAAVGASMAAIQGGSILMGALTGGIAGGLSFAGGYLAPGYGLIAAGAASGSINAAITGGDPVQGAWMGGLTAAVSLGTSSLTGGMLESVKSPLLKSIIQNGSAIGTGALTGGISAELTGGEFLTGAMYGAMAGGIAVAVPTITGSVLSAYYQPSEMLFPEGGSTNINDYDRVVINGILENKAAYQALANERNVAVFYNPTNGPILDLVECALQKFVPFSDPHAKSLSMALAGVTHPIEFVAYSQGTLTVTNAAILTGLPKGSTFLLYSSAVSSGRAGLAAAINGGTVASFNTPYFDIANTYSPALNPAALLSGFVDAFRGFDTHSRNSPAYQYK